MSILVKGFIKLSKLFEGIITSGCLFLSIIYFPPSRIHVSMFVHLGETNDEEEYHRQGKDGHMGTAPECHFSLGGLFGVLGLAGNAGNLSCSLKGDFLHLLFMLRLGLRVCNDHISHLIVSIVATLRNDH